MGASEVAPEAPSSRPAVVADATGEARASTRREQRGAVVSCLVWFVGLPLLVLAAAVAVAVVQQLRGAPLELPWRLGQPPPSTSACLPMRSPLTSSSSSLLILILK